MIRRLKAEFKKYHFAQTPGSKIPADLVSNSKFPKFHHFALIQAKTRSEKSDLTFEIDEKRTFLILVSFVKEVIANSKSTKRIQNKPFLITTGYVGVLRSFRHIKGVEQISHRIVLTKLYGVYSKGNLADVYSLSEQHTTAKDFHNFK